MKYCFFNGFNGLLLTWRFPFFLYARLTANQCKYTNSCFTKVMLQISTIPQVAAFCRSPFLIPSPRTKLLFLFSCLLFLFGALCPSPLCALVICSCLLLLLRRRRTAYHFPTDLRSVVFFLLSGLSLVPFWQQYQQQQCCQQCCQQQCQQQQCCQQYQQQ